MSVGVNENIGNKEVREIKTRYKNLIIDGSFFLHLYSLSLKPLYNSEFEDISISYYFLKRLYHIIETYKPLERVFVILDIGRDLKKKSKYELYKANRKITKKSNFTSTTLDEETYDRLKFNRKLIYEILKTTPIYILAIPYVEGDTILAFVKKFLDKEELEILETKNKEEIKDKKNSNSKNPTNTTNNENILIKNSLIITADKDFIQLVDDNSDLILMNTINSNNLYTSKDIKKLWEIVFFVKDTSLLNIFETLTSKTKQTLFEIKDILETLKDIKDLETLKNLVNTETETESYGILKPKNIVYYRVLTGDQSDNIGGIKGFGNVLVSSMILFHQLKLLHIFENIKTLLEKVKDKNKDNENEDNENNNSQILLSEINDLVNIYYQINPFSDIETFIEFFKIHSEEFEIITKNKFKKSRINSKRLKEFIENKNGELDLYKTFFELMDFDYSIDNIPTLVKQDLRDTLTKLDQNSLKEHQYKQEDFLEYIHEYEFNSENDYYLWDTINKVLNENLLILQKNKFCSLENNGWKKFEFFLQKDRVKRTIYDFNNELLNLISNTKLKNLFFI